MKRYTLTLTAIAVCFLLHKPAFTQEPAADSLPARFVTLPLSTHGQLGAANENLGAQAALAPTIPLWNGTASGYSYSMVGQNPQLTLSTQTTFVATPVIPIIFTFSGGATFDPTAPDSTCLGGNNAANLTMGSPLFGNYNFTSGGAYVGPATQYLDFFQRTNFWQYTNPAGVNPNYHLLLSASQLAPIVVSVPAVNGRVVTGGFCGGRLGEVDINWFDSYVQSTLFTQLAALGVLPSAFPIFLTHNVILYDKTPSNCCIIGYHTAFYNPRFGNAIQTYDVAEFDSTGAFGSATRDVAALSHEIGEWLDDPLANNPTPPWGNIGQVSGCQSDLEDGDPLTGTAITATMVNGFTYHLQELVFFSWFYNQTPSLGVNGWYSSNGTFKTPAAPCGGTGTPAASLSASSLNFSTQALGTSSSPQNITLTNTGTAALSGIAVSLTGINPGDFALVSNCPTSLAANANCSVAVTFKPTAALARSATVSFADNALGSPQTVSLTGTGAGTPQVSLSGSSINFGNQSVGTTSAAQNITLTNTGTAALSIGSIAIAGVNPADFAQTNNCLPSVAAGGNCSIAITFQPSAINLRSASVTIVDNAAVSSQSVNLTGIGTSSGGGTPLVSLNPGSLTFSSLNIGSSASQSFTLSNLGTGSLTSIAITVQGANASDFGQSNNCPATLTTNSSCLITVTFTPLFSGTRSALIVISDNAASSPQIIALTGTGLSAQALQPYLSSISTLIVPLNQTTNVIISGFNFQSGFTATLTTSAGKVSIPASALTFVSSNQIQVKVTPGGVAPFLATLTIANPGGLTASSQLYVLSF